MTDKHEMMITHAKEMVKMHLIYDMLNRMEQVYTAYNSTAHGGPCIKTTYAYDGVTVRITGMKEESAIWDSAWDI